MSNVVVDTSKLNIKILSPIQKNRAFNNAGLEFLRQITAKALVPKDTGTLERSGKVENNGKDVFIVYSTIYARFLYYGDNFNFATSSNQNAQSRWIEKLFEDKKNTINIVSFFIKREIERK